VWRVVDKKWPQFEEVFWEFDVERLLMMPDDMLERKAKDPAIIRNFSKVKTVRENAMMIDDTERREQQSFGEFIAGWPTDDVISLWLYLKKHGSRLGGNTGPFALRTLGVDTFLLTQDVEGFLRSHSIVDGGRTSQRALKSAQAYFNDLQEQSGKSLAELSRIISFCHGQNRVQ
jgi:3-methyladenine DNA glycosylase Tag